MKIQCILDAADKLQTPEKTEALCVENHPNYGNVKISIFSDKNASIVVDGNELIRAIENVMNK